jgi:anti-anti-sigma regulatory factor/HAMP domain-containing protein
MRLKVGTKFGSLSVLAFLMTLAAVTLGVFDLRALSGRTLRLSASADASRHAHQLHFDLNDVYLALATGIAQHDPTWFEQPLQGPLNEVAEDIANLNRALAEQGTPDRAAEINALHTLLTDEINTMMEMVKKAQWSSAYLRLANYIEPARNNFEAQIERVDEETARDAAEAIVAVREGEQAYAQKLLFGTCTMILLLWVISWLLWRNLVVPIHRLTQSATLLATGNWNTRTNIVGRTDELGALAAAFDSMANQLEASHHSLAEKVQQRTAELEAERAALQLALRELQTSTAEREELLTTLARLQNPVIPVIDGVVVAPIVGQLTAQRIQLLQRTILDTVVTTQARVALLDITGVPQIDEQCAALLLRIGEALKLLGATAILVGIRPEVAQQLITQDAALENVRSAIDLQGGIGLALRQLRRKIVPVDHALLDSKPGAIRTA